ncbi:Lipase (Class 3) [Pseudomonas sp. 8AS]|uniref:lipase family protein n=1 Tax=Pseudomonas sp. 8AS TaxID=2653163 RepID=UPI0012F1A248|nr:lipase family protein [Pseudomonas sp. 8AS]VXB03929.1 Lipase (Class 3) [Pseudomonas sp. 8AS]
MDETFAAALAAQGQQCPLRKQWVSLRLVDEFGDGRPYAGLTFQLVDTQGEQYDGVLDSDGYALVENMYCGPALVQLSKPYEGGVDTWYERLMVRESYALPITALQVAAEQTLRRPTEQPSPSPARGAREQAEFYRVEVRDLVEVTSHLPPASTILAPRPSAVLAANGAANASFGVALLPNRHHVLEVKALRAWRPLLSLTPEFSALDAYQLALFTTLAYADFGHVFKPGQEQPTYPQPGSIGHVLNARLAEIQTGAPNDEPGRFAKVDSYYPLLEEVPYSKRLEVVPYDPQRYTKDTERKQPWELHSLNHADTNTQAYISHDDRMILIGVRGTQENPPDLLRDIDAAQVLYKEGVGQAHHGFYDAFQAVKKFVTPYLANFFTGHKIVVCGHSLGGAIALLLAEWIRRDKKLKAEVLLYTYGAPRAGDRAFVEGASALVHHRIVNHNDPIPSVPTTWMDTDNRLLIPGAVALIGGATGPGALAFLAGVANLQGDPFQHHGHQHHFLPLTLGAQEETSVLWQPDCSGIEDAGCAYYGAKAGADMPDRAAFMKQLISIEQHFMTSYIPACHATLLRWKAASESATNTYLSAREARWLEREIAHYRENLEAWEAQARRRYEALGSDNRIGSVVQKRRELERALQRVQDEKERLPTTLGRIAQLSHQRIGKSELYGAQAANPLLDSLISRWLQHPRNQPSQTSLHARLPRDREITYA